MTPLAIRFVISVPSGLILHSFKLKMGWITFRFDTGPLLYILKCIVVLFTKTYLSNNPRCLGVCQHHTLILPSLIFHSVQILLFVNPLFVFVRFQDQLTLSNLHSSLVCILLFVINIKLHTAKRLLARSITL